MRLQRKHKTLTFSSKIRIIQEIKKNNREKERLITILKFRQALYRQIKFDSFSKIFY